MYARFKWAEFIQTYHQRNYGQWVTRYVRYGALTKSPVVSAIGTWCTIRASSREKISTERRWNGKGKNTILSVIDIRQVPDIVQGYRRTVLPPAKPPKGMCVATVILQRILVRWNITPAKREMGGTIANQAQTKLHRSTLPAPVSVTVAGRDRGGHKPKSTVTTRVGWMEHSEKDRKHSMWHWVSYAFGCIFDIDFVYCT